MLLFDNISRVHFHRKLKKVVKFLNEISEGEDSQYDVFEYFRYHSVGMNTYINKNGMFYGTSESLKSDRDNIFKYYSQNGYVTGFFIDQWQDIEALWENNEINMDTIYAFDHSGTTIAWDYNYEGVEKEIAFGTGMCNPLDRCLYGIIKSIVSKYIQTTCIRKQLKTKPPQTASP